jgi:WD40 repeat protein
VWETASGKLLACLHGHEFEVNALAFAPDGQSLLSSSADRTLRLWDISGGVERACLRGHHRAVQEVVFFSDGRRAASASFDGTVRCWDLSSGAEFLRLEGHQAEVKRVAISLDGARLVSQSVDQEIRVWEATNGGCLAIIPGAGDVSAIAAGPRRFSRRAVSRGLETVIESHGGQEVAWFPDVLLSIVTHPSGNTWMGRSGSHVGIITFESDS